MLPAIKIKEGFFCISWDVQNPTGYGQQWGQTNRQSIVANQVDVSNLTEIFKSCKLSYKIEEDLHGVLEMETVISNEMGRGKLETILVQVTKNGVQQLMTLRRSTWTITWKKCEWKPSCNCKNSGTGVYPNNYGKSCGYCRRPFTLESPLVILIQSDLGSSISLKKGPQHVIDHLLNLWKTKTLSNVTFQCKTKSIEAHTLILASGSPVLAAMFQHDFTENQKKVVVVKEIEANVFEELLCFIYTGNFCVTKVDVAKLLVAADKYAVETLKEECAMYLANTLTVENALSYLVTSHLHNSPMLYQSALDFITKKENEKIICRREDWMQIIKNYPELCFQVTQLMMSD
ncbi:speckle-type POZ protein-like [Daphnia carinata]|uniref:speckle-type POZ protein-like n=1 Tax=Daphnia carinata TaxID=120202 RepID=UPI00257E936C|nr:speckle-type POZ protein-like [Daphnia carinata]